MANERFKREMDRALDALYSDVNKVLEESTVYGWNLITAGTPVRTGRARASWLITIDKVEDTTKPKAKGNARVYEDPSTPAISYDVRENSHLHITNNVNYIEYLEYGTDKFAPFGMVMSAVPKITNRINQGFKQLDHKEYK